MYKVVINACYGGFSLSEEACEYLNNKYGMNINKRYGHIDDDVKRHDKRLVEVVEELGSDVASGSYARLRVAEIDTPMYRIDEYDGNESIYTPDEQEWIVIEEDE